MMTWRGGTEVTRPTLLLERIDLRTNLCGPRNVFPLKEMRLGEEIPLLEFGPKSKRPGLPKIGFDHGSSRSEGERINRLRQGCRYTPLSSSLVTGQLPALRSPRG